MNPALDGFIRTIALFQLTGFMLFRGPLERYYGPMKYLVVVIGASECYRNFAGLPEEMKSDMRRKMRPIFVATIFGIIIGAML